ncbi:MAG: hypothetical protein GY699_21255 [Desulfobacteraceae bacterium]|nr:hypothetical protein [Desulfobacteraceae bacterium]
MIDKNLQEEKNQKVTLKSKKAYEKPTMEEHEPLEESTAYVYYYYVW